MAAPIRPQQLFTGLGASSLPVQRYVRPCFAVSLQQRTHNVEAQRPRRTFATSPACQAGKGAAGRTQMIKPKTRAQPSMKTRMADLKRNVDMLPNDNGLLPDTFIMPFGANRPSILTDYKRRWTLEKERIKRMVIDLVAVLSVKYRFVKPRPDLQYFQVTKIAKGLYESMYEQFAAGNLDPIRPRLCESIEENLTARIANRPKNTHLQWKLHRYIGRPSLMSYRAGMMQLNDDNEKQTGITQAVVRIRSEQSLRRVKRIRGADGKVLEVLEEGSVMGANDGSKGKEVVEYFVIQRMIRNGVWGDWMIWGTTQESTVESVERARRRKLGLGDDE